MALEHYVEQNCAISESMLMTYVKRLRCACAPGVDGIMAEHIKWAEKSKVISAICNMIGLCVKFGIVPDTFMTGLLIPLLKKPHSDPSVPKNYRPVVISTTFSKLMEIHILENCGIHEFHDLQFGFIPNRGTSMAVTLTHDVMEHFISRGTPVYACSLDAEGAFDSLPHAIMFQKTVGLIPDIFWRILVFWYRGLVVRIRWAGALSKDIRIWKGTRQGGLSSPFVFNTFYKDLVQGLSDMQCGTKIDSTTYNVFCYADDLLVTSATVTGLQKLLDYAEQFITSHGLRFNPIKTQCITFGKSRFSHRSWYLSGVALEEATRITYLGVTLSNDSCAHSNDRTKSAKRAYYALQGAGICANGTSTETLVHLYQAAIRPVLMYGLVCVHQNKTAIDDARSARDDY